MGSAVGDSTEAGWHLDRIGTWNRASAGSGIVVGLADSWLHPVDPALALPASRLRAFGPDGLETDAVAVPSSHGTSGASLVASSAHGVAPCASLVFASVLRQPDGRGRCMGTPGQVAAGLRWLAASKVEGRPVRIVNASLTVDDAPVLREAVAACLASGIVIVAPTGNDAATVGYPAAYPGVVSVGALDRLDRRADSTGRGGAAPDIWAPGVSVPALGALGRSRPVGGTSVAAAIVAGAIAAMMSERDGLDSRTIHAHLARAARRLAGGERGLWIG